MFCRPAQSAAYSLGRPEQAGSEASTVIMHMHVRVMAPPAVSKATYACGAYIFAAGSPSRRPQIARSTMHNRTLQSTGARCAACAHARLDGHVLQHIVRVLAARACVQCSCLSPADAALLPCPPCAPATRMMDHRLHCEALCTHAPRQGRACSSARPGARPASCATAIARWRGETLGQQSATAALANSNCYSALVRPLASGSSSPPLSEAA